MHLGFYNILDTQQSWHRIWLKRKFNFLSAACTPGSWGIKCQETCNCKDSAEKCTHTDGMCQSGCNTGYGGVSCNKGKECSPKYDFVNYIFICIPTRLFIYLLAMTCGLSWALMDAMSTTHMDMPCGSLYKYTYLLTCLNIRSITNGRLLHIPDVMRAIHILFPYTESDLSLTF